MGAPARPCTRSALTEVTPSWHWQDAVHQQERLLEDLSRWLANQIRPDDDVRDAGLVSSGERRIPWPCPAACRVMTVPATRIRRPCRQRERSHRPQHAPASPAPADAWPSMRPNRQAGARISRPRFRSTGVMAAADTVNPPAARPRSPLLTSWCRRPRTARRPAGPPRSTSARAPRGG